MKVSRTIGLGIGVLALAGYVFWFERHRLSSSEREAQREHAFQVNIDRVQELRLQTGSYQVELFATNRVWNVRYPEGARASEATVRRILSRLQNFRRGGLITVEDMRRQGNTLADYGLEVPDLILTLHTPQGEREYRVGNPSPLGNKLYIKEESSQNVMLVSIDLLEVVPEDVNAFYDPVLFPIEADEVEALALVSTEQTLRLERGRDSWWITEPRRLQADAPRLQEMVTKLLQARAEGFENDQGEEAYGFDEPADTLRIWPMNSKVALSLSLGADIPESPGLCYARLEGRGGVLKVSSGLRAMVQTPLDRLRNPNVLSALQATDIDQITIQYDAQTITFEKRHEDWFLTKPVSRPLLSAKVETLIRAWQDAKVVDFSVTGDYASPSAQISFSSRSQDTSITYELLEATTLPGRSLLRDTDGGVIRVTPDLASRISYRPEAFLSPTVLAIEIENVVRLNVVRDFQTLSYSRSTPDADWTLSDTGFQVLPDSIQQLLESVSSLQAKDVVALQPESLEPYGLENPALRISIGSGGTQPSNQTLLLSSLQADGTVYAQRMGDQVVYQLQAGDAANLRAPLVRALTPEGTEAEDPIGETP